MREKGLGGGILGEEERETLSKWRDKDKNVENDRKK